MNPEFAGHSKAVGDAKKREEGKKGSSRRFLGPGPRKTSVSSLTTRRAGKKKRKWKSSCALQEGREKRVADHRSSNKPGQGKKANQEKRGEKKRETPSLIRRPFSEVIQPDHLVVLNWGEWKEKGREKRKGARTSIVQERDIAPTTGRADRKGEKNGGKRR